jgi:hypothetical protein
MTERVIFHGTRGQITELAHQLAATLAGQVPDSHGIARGFLLSIGMAALSDIRLAYEVKAKGGTDAMGIKWPPLSPETIARRRVGPRDLKDPAIKERETIRKREYRKLYKRLLASMPDAEARQKAKHIAGIRATRQTGRTRVDVLGNRVVEILRDTGVLMNSLGPGELTAGGEYQKPHDEGGEHQILEVNPGHVIVGTNVLYAGTHQHGDPSRNIPQRKFLPESNSDVPAEWWDNWLEAGADALEQSAKVLFQNGPGH